MGEGGGRKPGTNPNYFNGNQPGLGLKSLTDDGFVEQVDCVRPSKKGDTKQTTQHNSKHGFFLDESHTLDREKKSPSLKEVLFFLES